MLVTIISWLYIFAVCVLIGTLINRLLSKIIPVPGAETIGITGIVVMGLVALTAYGEYFSIFYKIGLLCHCLMLVFAATGFMLCKKEIAKLFKKFCGKFFSAKGLIYILIVLTASFYSSRGDYHTDTGIYHAQAIRIIEEYGVIKGLGNFQLHFAYNSSYLVLCSLFTLSFLLPAALHSMTGFFMVLFTCYAVDGLFNIKKHRHHGGDMARIAVLIYALSNMTGLQSPATDYGTMFMTLYLLCAWITYSEEKGDSGEDVAVYGYLSVLSIFAVSMKLSAAALVILAALPLVLLLREKRYKETSAFIAVGFLSFLPYLIRNVIISGWLFYPVESIDLFDVKWKIPVEYMRIDSAQIKVWGRCLYDISRLNDGVSVWLPVWWEGQQFYGKMLVCSCVLGFGFLILQFIKRAKGREIRPSVLIFYVTIIVNLVLWFFTAPFIRYGLAFLLMLPLCAYGDFIGDAIRNETGKAILIAAVFLLTFFPWLMNYAGDDIEFVSNFGGDGYFFYPIPFEDAQTDAVDMDGVTVYNSTEERVNSYYYYPNSCYHDMINRTRLIGSTIEEGFMPREGYPD